MSQDDPSDAPKPNPPQKSILALIGEKIGEVPHVSLHDEGSAAGSGPVIDPSCGETLSSPRGRGNYQLMGEVARGGMGVVLRGHDTDLGRDVALKVLHKDLANNAGVLQRFVEEAQIGGQLQHPGIVPVYELGLMEDARPYFTMKLVKGKTLAALMSGRSSPAEDRARLVDVFESVCQTMAYAHSRGVIHRDLKPSNVMVGAFGEVQVVDWGLAKVMLRGGNADEERARLEHDERTVLETVRSAEAKSGSSHSMAGSVMGTPAYMPPEQAAGRVDKLDERSDVFSLGAILCEVLTGLPPYPGDFGEAIQNAANARLDEALARLDTCGAASELIELTKQCLMPAQLARPQSAEVVAKRVRDHIESTENRAHKAEVEAAVQRRSKWLWSVMVGMVLLFGGGGFAYTEWQASQALQRTYAFEEEVRAARFEAASLRGRAREESDLDLWNQCLAVAVQARTIASTHGLDVEAEVATWVATLEGELATFIEEKDRAARTEEFLTTISSLSDSPLAFIGGGDRIESRTANFLAAFQALGIDILRLPVNDAIQAIQRLGIGRPNWEGEVGRALDSWATTAVFEEGEHLTRVANGVDRDPMRTRIRKLYHSNDFDAILDLATSPEAHQAAPETIFFIVGLLARSGLTQPMSPLIRSGRDNHPDNLTLNLMRGMMLTFSGQELWMALPYFAACQAIQPEEPIGSFFQSAALAALDRPDDALLLLDTALERTRGIELVNYVASVANAFRISRRTDALDRLEALLAQRMESQQVRFALAPLRMHRGDFSGAAILFQEAVEALPDSRQWLLPFLSTCLSMTGEHAAAISALRELVELNPDDRFSMNALSWTLSTCPDLDLRAPEEAVELSERVCALEPDVPIYTDALGVALYRLGEFDGAVGVLEQTVKLNSGNPMVRGAYFRAMALYQLGEVEEARAAFEEAKRLGWSDASNPMNDPLWAKQREWIHAEAEELLAGK